MKNRLEEIGERPEIVGNVHGIGLMLGVEIVEDKAAKVPFTRTTDTTRRGCAAKDVLIHATGTGGSILSIVPPMISTMDEADKV